MKKQLTMIAVVLLSISCKKNAEQVVIGKSTITSSRAIVAAGNSLAPVNPLNPYDSIGQRHNVVLDSVWNYVQKTKDTTAAGKRNYIIGYFEKYRPKDAAAIIQQNLGNEKLQPYNYQQILQDSNFQQQTKELITKLFEDISHATNMDSYPLLIKEILQIESSALKASLPLTDKAAIFQAASIARYSAFFWKVKIGNNPIPSDNNPVAARSIIRFIASVQADTAGFLYGLFSGDAEGEAEYQSSLWTWYVDAFA